MTFPYFLKTFTNFIKNLWDAEFCSDGNIITDAECLKVRCTKSWDGDQSVFAKHSIHLNSDVSNIFYFEISVKSLGGEIIDATFGFSSKTRNAQASQIVVKLPGTRTYAYRHKGNFYINGVFTKGNPDNSYGAGDTVGCGVNLSNGQIIFTKNGHRLDYSFLRTDSSTLHPFVSLNNRNDEIEANFGPAFKFDWRDL
ncbi:hypothetical protein niasHS_001373 [Heterodera schachtii]|uniref:B30.2/SPRY domain-containing protein n=1 Tax=Heterodera schachtii TaxID=97005 RepID=A0ABD2KDX9_HETSC